MTEHCYNAEKNSQNLLHEQKKVINMSKAIKFANKILPDSLLTQTSSILIPFKCNSHHNQMFHAVNKNELCNERF